MRHRPFLAAVPFALLLASAAAAQQPARAGTTVVEIIGLRTWTRQMVEDSVAKYQPGVSLTDHACAVILRDSVGFANAASQGYSMGGDTSWTVLPVVEPAQRAQVRPRVYAARQPKIAEWTDLFTVLEQHPQALNYLQHPEVLVGDGTTAFGEAVPAPALELRRRLRWHRTPHDWALARAALLSDSSATNRTVAALVLSNFADRDSAYHLLAEGLRANDMGSSAAVLVLNALSRGAPRRVNWAPARDALEALAGGTNLFAYTDFLRVLVATDIDPLLGRELARVDSHLLLSHLGAANPYSPPPVHQYLVHVGAGRDFGRDTAAWQAWLSES